MKNTMIHNLVKHLPGLKHIKSEFYRGFVLYTFLISAFLTLGVGQMWGVDYYFRHWDANNSTHLIDQGSNIHSAYFILSGSISFKISDDSWTNANTFGKSSSAISLNSEYSCASPGSDFSLNFSTNRAYLVRLNASGSTKKLLISTFVPSAAAPSAVVSGTNAMFYIQGYEGLNYLVNSSKTKASNSYPMNYTGISYVNTAKTNLSTYDRISNNPSDWNGDEATNIKSATGGELITRANAKTAAKTASTTTSVSGDVLSISTTTNSTTGVYGNLPLYIQYYIDGTFVGVSYNSSTASYGSITAGGGTARASTFDVSELTNGTHTLKTVLTDGIIYWVADTDNFTVSHPVFTVTIVGGTESSTEAGPSAKGTATVSLPAGKKFTGWTLGDGVSLAAGYALTDATIKINATKASTVTANFATRASVKMYFAKPTRLGWSKVYAYAWKSSDASVKNAAYPGVELTNTEVINCVTYYTYQYYTEADGIGGAATGNSAWNRIIFGDNNDARKTGDLTISNNHYYYKTSTGTGATSAITSAWGIKTSKDAFAGTSYITHDCANNKGSVDIDLAKNTTYDFKVYDAVDDLWWSNSTAHGSSNPITGSMASATALYSDDANNMDVKTTVAGSYTFEVGSTNADHPTIKVTYPAIYAITGEFNSWTETSNMVFDGNVGTAVINLTARDAVYEFKVLDNGAWSGGDHAITGTTSNLDITVGGGNNMTIKADVYTSGNYTFTYNKSTHKLAVTYPTSYQISFSRVPTEGGKTNPWGNFTGVIEEKQITSGVTKIADGATAHFYAANAADGYTYYGWYKVNDAPKGTYTNRLVSSQEYTTTVTSTTPTNLYAKYYPNDYTVTLDKQTSAPGYGDGGTCGNQTVTYHTALPAISGTMPSGTGVYGFMGFYTETGGEGTKVINADGTWVHGASGYTTADGKWDGLSDVTLYAYYKQAEITDIELNPAAVEWKESGDNFVKANPIIDPNPASTVKVCWELLYDNEDPVTGHDAIEDTEGGTKPRQVKFNLGGLAAGNYRIRAKLYLGSSCGGTLLNTFDKTVTVTNNFTVTVFYKCGDVTIKSSDEVDALPITAKSITAPDITGYTFHHWVLGDGVTCTSGTAGDAEHAGTATISYTAIFDGSLTAVYTRKRMIYFYNTLGWSTVNVYFYKNSSYWDNSGNNWGSGAKNDYEYTDYPYSEQKHGTMTQIEGTNIWYFDCEAATVPAAYKDVVFTEANQHGYGYFSNTKVSRRGDYNTALPMFVPLADQKVETYNTNAKYYNNGYWMNYPENTGYTLKIYGDPLADNVTGAIREYLFPYSGDLKMPWKADVEFNFTGQIWFMIYRNDGQLLGKNYTMKQEWHETELDIGSDQKIEIKTSAPGVYKFTLSFLNVGTVDVPNYKYYIFVEYPVSIGDYRIKYNDRAAWSGATHTASWWHASDIIRKNTGSEAKSDTVSLYVAYGSTPSAKFQKVTAIDNNTGAVTWEDVDGGTVSLTGITEKGVYNFIVSQPTGGASISLTKKEKYTGNFYIRTDNAGSTKWDNYRAFDHQMTYSEFSFSDANTTDPAKKYSHYFASWCERGTNIQFCVANDYSACISDTLMQDVGNPYKNTDEYGTLKTDGAAAAINDRYSSNVRFMYNYSTNKISRAYVASATNPERLFLVLRANAEIDDESGEAYEAQDIPNAAILMDKENWIYEEILYITPGTRFKLFASYALKDPYRMDSVQYFRGAHADGDNKTTCTFNASNSVILIGGSGSMQKARVIYDFKTNRLIAAWIPDGTDIDNPIGINADVLIEREHQKPAEYITFSDDGALTGVKTIYGAMKFNRWILNNRSNPYDIDPLHAKTAEQISTYHPPLPVGQQKSIYERSLYFISFPFDVNVSEIFGFGHYWDEWYLEYYDGLTRAKNGYWIDSPPNWKYVTPEMASSFVLKANVGYILGIDLDYMQAENDAFWSNGISTVELFFPSTTTATGSITDITEVVIPALGTEYKCNINRTGIDGDRRVKDSYWRCIGVPSFNLYNTAVEDASGNVIEWKTDYTWREDEKEFPFIYRWNMSDNTITPQATSTFSFQPMHSYLVQNGGEIHWKNVSGPAPSPIVARRAKKEDYREYNWCLALMSDTNLIDQTYVRMSELEQITDTFDFGQDMSKEFNAYRSDLYTKIGYERVAANSMPLNTETTTIVPVGIKVYKAGEFTLSMPDGTYGVSITLVDNNTGARTELGAGFTYSFESEAGQLDDRFYLEIAKIKDIATGTEEIGEPSKSDVRKVMINGILYIVRGDQIFDALGNRVE